MHRNIVGSSVVLCGILASAGLPLPIAAAASESPPVDALTQWLGQPADQRPALNGEAFARAPLDKPSADHAKALLWADHVAQFKATRSQEWANEAITVGNKTLKLKERHFGHKPADGWNLFISMHGGGNAPPALNDQQWENQIRLYQPKDSLYIAPRAPTNTWNLWHEPHIDVLFARLIEDAIVLGDVNPNRVYVMGYSAGGDGVYQLAPRMADRWAAASMMAGHPNDADPLGLRNVPFAIHVGALDGGFDRNRVAAEWGQKLDALQHDDPGGYVHDVQLHPGRAHWMNLEDAVAVGWMARFTRNPIPERVDWRQSPVTHERLYWLAMAPGDARGGQIVVASRDGQHIIIRRAEGVERLIVMLNDAMLDLNRPVTISMDGKDLFNGTAARTIERIAATMEQDGDPFLTFDAAVTVDIPGPR